MTRRPGQMPRQRSELDALNAQIERREHAARQCGYDPLLDLDDLDPSRGIIWAALAVLCTLAVLAMLLLPGAAGGAERESEPVQVWGVVNTVSWHADRACEVCPEGQLNQANWGGGLEARFAHGLGAGVGLMRNSYSELSMYLIGLWQPLATNIRGVDLAAGVFAGAVTGYEKDHTCEHSICPAAGLVLTVSRERVGVNVTYIPAITPKDTTTFGLQLKVRLV